MCVYIHMIVYSQTILYLSLLPLKNFFFELCMQRDILRIKDVRRSKFLRTDQVCGLNFWLYRQPRRYLWSPNAAKRRQLG